MEKRKYVKPAVLIRLSVALSVVLWLASCAVEDNPAFWPETYSTRLFVATDRHENGEGNNLTAMLARAVEGCTTQPWTVLLGGDYVGGMHDMTPAFSINDVYNEIYAVTDPLSTRVMMTYGSHDNACVEGYQPFYSGPCRCDGYYTYGISYIQMTYDTDSAAIAAIRYYEEHGDERPDDMPPPPRDEDGTMPPPPSGEGGGKPRRQGYNGIDQADPYGISAESAARSFTQWVSTIADRDPIVVMSHVPLHANRGDNLGALTWYKALTAAAQRHNVLVLWGHNHTLEENGDTLEQTCYLLTAGDSITVQGDSIAGAVRCPLSFTYANAGYLTLGHATVVTFSDTNGSGSYNRMDLRRYSLDATEDEREYGKTGKPNPYVVTF